jgi:putative FmdB family regulatory protein
VPTYEYACAECGERLEAVQKFTDDPLTVCPACGGKLRKLFSPVGIVFKGSGFYRNDSRVPASNGSKDKQQNGSSTGSSSTTEKSSGTDQKTPSSGSSSSGSSSGSSSSGSSSSEAKPGAMTGSGSSGKSSSTGTKVA